jgi:ornithine carbamoyltransferase
MRVATPPKYGAPQEVWDTIERLEGVKEKIFWTADPKEAVNGADVVITDTWYVFLFLSV